MPSTTITVEKAMSAAVSILQIASKRHCTKRASVRFSLIHSQIGCRKCSEYSAMRGNQWPTAHKYVNYSGGSNTLNSKTQSRLLNSGLTLTELHIQRQLTTSHPLYPIFHSTNCTKKFLAFWPAESTLGAKVSAAAQVKVVATAAASTIHRGMSTKAITIIGNI